MAGRPGYLHLSFYWTEVRWSKFINIWKQATWTVQYIVSQLPVIATCVCVWVPAPNTLRSWLVAKLVFLMRSNKRLILLLEYKVFLTGQKCNKLCWSLSLCSTTGHSKSHSQQKGELASHSEAVPNVSVHHPLWLQKIHQEALLGHQNVVPVGLSDI